MNQLYKEQYIVSMVNSGLCNRMKNLLTILRLSEKHSLVPILYWLNNNAVQCEFHDLFKNKINLISDEKQLKKIYQFEDWREFRYIPKKMPQVKYILLNSWRLLISPGDVQNNFSDVLPGAYGNEIDFEYHRIPEKIKNDYINILIKLQPVDYIMDNVHLFQDRFTDNTVSVHVRSWADAKNRNDLIFNCQDFFKKMDSLNKNTFFISCDSEPVLEIFQKRYGEKILYFPKKTYTGDRSSKIGIQEALIDLYLLSKNNRIITTYLSSFSEMAWWLGLCKAKIDVVGSSPRFRRTLMQTDRRKNLFLTLKNIFYKKYLNLKN